MIEITAKVSSKNQVTLPADVRKTLGIRASERISFVLSDDGTVELRQPKYTLESVLGSIRAIPGESLDLEREINTATSEVMGRKFPIKHFA